MQGILEFGVRLITGFQFMGNWLELPMKFFSFLGTEEFFSLVLPILYWCIDTSLGVRVAVILMFSAGINDGLKMALHGPRPYWISSQVKALSTETSFGVPSGHAQSAVAVWGVLASFVRKWWAWLIAILLMILCGLSRLYLGVHFPQDVLFGWIIGGLILWLTLHFWDPVVAWVRKLVPGKQILYAFITSLVLLLIPLVPYFWLKATSWQAPTEWGGFAANAISLEGATTAAGTFFGLMAGLVWLNHLGWFDTKGAWWKLLLRYILGVAGVLIIRYGLKFIFPSGESLVSNIFRYLRYALIGFWVTGGAPWVFLKLGLAEKKSHR
jgi:membrane-associated phospholipid phosphatase